MANGGGRPGEAQGPWLGRPCFAPGRPLPAPLTGPLPSFAFVELQRTQDVPLVSGGVGLVQRPRALWKVLTVVQAPVTCGAATVFLAAPHVFFPVTSGL